jgi:hypothetical protein
LSSFNPDESVIAVDLKTLLATSNVDVNEAGTPPGCMADPDDAECAVLMPRFGLTFPSGQPDASAQQFFHLLQQEANAQHVEIFAASSSDGGGALLAHAEFDEAVVIPLFFSDCLGGSDASCTGGTRVYTAVNPGIEPLDESEPDEGTYVLADNTTVALEVTAIDPGLTIRYGDTVLQNVGDHVDLGTTPQFHADLQPQIALPNDALRKTYVVSLKLTTTSPAYTASDVFALKYVPRDAAQPD